MRTLISFPLLVFTTAALTAGPLASLAEAQERSGPLVITAPRFDTTPAVPAAADRFTINSTPIGAPDFAPETRLAAAEQSTLGGGFIEFLVTGRTGSRTTLPRQPDDRAWQNAYPDRETDGRYDERYSQRMFYGPREQIEPRDQVPRPAFDPRFRKQTVSYTTVEKPGTVIIDTKNRFLYLVQEDGKAIRYGIGVGRIGFTWNGTKHVSQKREWPDWRPPDEMRKRRPDLPVWMAGGVDNPLGARAIYLGDSLYRIHGSNEPHTIGTAVSSGCFRMRNDDVIDLYDRVKIGTKVVVI